MKFLGKRTTLLTPTTVEESETCNAYRKTRQNNGILYFGTFLNYRIGHLHRKFLGYQYPLRLKFLLPFPR